MKKPVKRVIYSVFSICLCLCLCTLIVACKNKNPNDIKDIKIDFTNVQTTLIVDEEFSDNGLKVYAITEAGKILQVTDFTITTNINKRVAGNYTATVHYKNFSKSFAVSYKNATDARSLSVQTGKKYFVGQDFASAGVIVTASFYNGTTGIVKNYTTNFDSTKIGDQQVTITYTGVTCLADVVVLGSKDYLKYISEQINALSLSSFSMVTSSDDVLTYLSEDMFYNYNFKIVQGDDLQTILIDKLYIDKTGEIYYKIAGKEYKFTYSNMQEAMQDCLNAQYTVKGIYTSYLGLDERIDQATDIAISIKDGKLSYSYKISNNTYDFTLDYNTLSEVLTKESSKKVISKLNTTKPYTLADFDTTNCTTLKFNEALKSATNK